MPRNDPDYYVEYYEANGDDINQKRRERYDNDPEYRDRVLMASQKYRDANRRPVTARRPRHAVPVAKDVGCGGQILLWSVGAFATYVRRSVQTISHWEEVGFLPRTPYCDSRGHRHYTKEMMVVVSEEVAEKRRLFPVDEEMRQRIEDGWRALGVPLGETGGMKKALAKTKLPK
jgi:DNA-binding transcriptional MerR regulator